MKTDRELKQELKSRIERFLYEKIDYGDDVTSEVKALNDIVCDLINLKFEGGMDKVNGTVVDASRYSFLWQKVPFPKEEGDHQPEYRAALLATSMWLQNLACMMTDTGWE
jgi:hypothetical protein